MTTSEGPATVREILGVPVHALTLGQVVDRVAGAIAERRRLQIGVVNAAKVVNMRRDPVLRSDVFSSDIVLADGIAVVWAGRLLREPVPERVTGIDLMYAILRRGSELSWRIFCLGATAEVLARVVGIIVRDYPGVVLAGSQHGYFSEAEEDALAARISSSRADVLFVAMTSPRKERFLARWSATLGVPVCHGVGGSFDVLAGVVQRAPDGWRRLGLEWLYRVKQEPRRLWKRYLVTNTVFAWMLLQELGRRGWMRLRGRRRDPAPSGEGRLP